MSVQGVSLFTGVGVGVPIPVPREVAAALDAVEIVTAIGERGSFRLFFRLDRQMNLPARFLFDSGETVRVALVVGSGAAASVAMDGLLVEHAVSTGTGTSPPRLVISGEDLTRVMDLNETVTRSFPGMPLHARVQLLLAAYAPLGVTALVVPPPIVSVPLEADRVPQQQGTDYAYIRALADSVGYRFTLDPGLALGSSTAYWGPEPRGDRSRPSLMIDFRRPRPVEELELRFDAMRRAIPHASILDPVSKAVIPIPVPNINGLGAPLGRVVPPAHRLRRIHTAAKLTLSEAAGELLADAARSAEATTGRGQLRIAGGQLRLRAGSLVEVRRGPEAFNGLYAVARVRDSITAARHSQEFELIRAGLGAA